MKVLAVDVKSSYDGNYQTSCTVDIDSGTAGTFAGSDVTASISLRLAARTDSGTGTIHAQQVQISGNASGNLSETKSKKYKSSPKV